MNKKQMCDTSDLRTKMALEEMNRNLHNIPVEDLEKFVEQHNTFTR